MERLRLKSWLAMQSPPTRTEILVVRVGGLCNMSSGEKPLRLWIATWVIYGCKFRIDPHKFSN
jgi:hypothetical protein